MKKQLGFIIVVFSSFIVQFCYAQSQYTSLYDFSTLASGAYPKSALTVVGNKFYGVTSGGGASNYGVIYSIDTNGSNYKDIHDYTSGTVTNPIYGGNLILNGSLLYGMDQVGGTNNDGVIFCIDTDGTGYRVLLDFNSTNGENPYGSLVISGNTMYGVTNKGGANGYGLIFSIDTNGNNYKDLVDFNSTNGAQPFGGITLLQGKLYGITFVGGLYQEGNIFSVDTNGSNFKDLLDFYGGNGGYPLGNLVIIGNTMYGMANGGGAYANGMIFSVDTGGNNFKDLLDFDVTNGAGPCRNLTIVENKMYGMTNGGGVYGHGIIFSIDTDGNNYEDMFDFDGTNGKNSNSALTIIGNTLYGAVNEGGASGHGVIFSFKDTAIKTSINNKLNTGAGGINIYPNPSNGVFKIQSSGVTDMLLVEVFNILGEKVYSKFMIDNGQLSINMSSQPNGIYLYRISLSTGDIVGEGKIEIQN